MDYIYYIDAGVAIVLTLILGGSFAKGGLSKFGLTSRVLSAFKNKSEANEDVEVEYKTCPKTHDKVIKTKKVVSDTASKPARTTKKTKSNTSSSNS